MLWVDDRITGVVNWPNSCRGPAGVDLGWCRHNLVRLHGVREADRFLDAYLSMSGPSFEYHPYWDLITLADALDWASPDRDPGGRLDEYLASLLARL